MDSDDITAEKIREAAKKLGLTIATGICYAPNTKCGCPMFILSAEAKGLDYADAELASHTSYIKAFDWMLELGASFIRGFITSFDGDSRRYEPGYDLDYDDGYSKGSIIRTQLGMGS